MKVRICGVLFAFIIFFSVIGCDSKTAVVQLDRFDSGTIHISCDESFKPIIDAQVQVYQASYPDTKIIVHYKPEADCLRDFAVDSIKMVIATRGYSEKEGQYISDTLKVKPKQETVAFDAIAVIVHPAAKATFFNKQELKALLGGKTKSNLIPVVDGVKATSTIRYIIDSLLEGGNLGNNVVAAQSS
ncbi:MAG TPA: substrate-binding domain-containing protein, partial [Flavisolibacter sp.]|nr:substrate-binding domain-containing protein [Flavisolibacter sp.]